MQSETVSPMIALNEGWRVFNRHFLVLSLGTILCAAVITVCAMIPYANWVLLAVVPFPLLGGLQALFLNAARDKDPMLSDVLVGFGRCKDLLVSGYQSFGVWLLFQAALTGMSTVVWCLLTFDARRSEFTGAEVWAYWTVVLLPSFVLAMAMYTKYVFVWPATADGRTWSIAQIRGDVLARGRGFQLFLSFLTVLALGPLGLAVVGTLVHATGANAFGLAGWCMFWGAVFVTTVVSICSVTATYVRLDSSNEYTESHSSTVVTSPVALVAVAPESEGPVTAFQQGWRTFKKHSVLLTGCTVGCGVVIAACANVPHLNWLLVLAIPFPLLGGLQRLFLNAARDNNPSPADVFSGFRQMGSLLICGYVMAVTWGLFQLLAGLVVGFTSLPFWTLFERYDGIGVASPAWASALSTSVCLLISGAATLAAFSGHFFVWPALADGEDWRTTDIRSRQLAAGRHWKLFLSFLFLGSGPIGLLTVGSVVQATNGNTFGWPGWVVFWAVVSAATALCICGATSVYVDLQSRTSPQIAEGEKAAA